MHPVTDAEKKLKAQPTLVNKYMPLWGYPVSILSDNGLQLCSELWVAILKRLLIRKTTTRPYHSQRKRWCRTCQPHDGTNALHSGQRTPRLLGCEPPPCRTREHQAISAATDLAPNHVHVNLLSRFPIAIFYNIYSRGQQILAHDQLEYCNRNDDRQQQFDNLVLRTTSSQHPQGVVSALYTLRCPTTTTCLC